MAAEARTIGPLDPDNSSELTARLGVHNMAHELLIRHARNYPAALTAALSNPVHPQATEWLRDPRQAQVRGAIIDYARSLKGKEAFLRGDAKVEDLSVRAPALGLGIFGDPNYIAVIYRLESGRSARAAIPFEAVPEVGRAYADFLRADAAAAGGTPVGLGDDAEAVREQARAEVIAAEQAKAEAENRARDLEERLARLENPEPFEGYDGMSARDIISRVKEGGAQEFGATGLQRVLTYEESSPSPRSTVIEAVKDAQAENAER